MTDAAESSSPRPRPLRSLLSVVVGCLLLALAVAALKGWRDHQQARAREARLIDEIAATESRIQALERKIERLQDDPATLDRVAREELGLVRPDEVVLVLPETPRRAAGR